MRAKDLIEALKQVPPDSVVNCYDNDHPDEFAAGCVAFSPKLRVVVIQRNDSGVSHVERILWNAQQEG
jgi:hypothetical protein